MNHPKLRWDAVDEQEQVTRFLVDEGHEFSRSNRRVKSAAFRVGPTGRLSVFRISNESLAGDIPADLIWDLGRTYVEPTRGPVLARVDLMVAGVWRLGFQTDPDGKPHLRHANITGWPDKEKQLELRQALAKAARLVLRD